MNYSQYLNSIFPGIKVQKISVNAGFSCPNRDGRIGTGGCIYCRNDSFSPGYCLQGNSLTEQIENGKKFFSRKYPNMKYLVYFQSYTNTYGKSINTIIKFYNEAIACKDVVGIVVGTRPDCLNIELLDYFELLNQSHPVFIEIGAETSSDYTLNLINRGHSWQDVVEIVGELSKRRLHIGLHLIAGLPNEDEQQILQNIRNACTLPIETLKIHHLQILEGTPLLSLWQKGLVRIHPFELEEYIELCIKIIDIVPKHIVLERLLAQSPPELVVAPKWGIKNYQFMNLLQNRMKRRSLK